MWFVVESGLRGIVVAMIDGVQLPMLVHANAGFTAMVTHAALHRINGRQVAKEQEFGLDHDLQLSTSGRGHTRVNTLEVAGSVLADCRLEVFDLPTVNWEGMLGTEWLAQVGAVVDFGGSRLSIPADPAERRALLPDDRARAVRSAPLEREARTGRFHCSLALDDAGRTAAPFVASTVAETTLDAAYATAHDVPLGVSLEPEHGPGGAVVPVSRTRAPLTLFAQGRPFTTVSPVVYDLYAYAQTSRPEDASATAGYLGADVLRAQAGVIDFGP